MERYLNEKSQRKMKDEGRPYMQFTASILATHLVEDIEYNFREPRYALPQTRVRLTIAPTSVAHPPEIRAGVSVMIGYFTLARLSPFKNNLLFKRREPIKRRERRNLHCCKRRSCPPEPLLRGEAQCVSPNVGHASVVDWLSVYSLAACGLPNGDK